MTPAPGTPIGVTLLAADLGKAERFYGELLGWSFRTGPTDEGGQADPLGHYAATAVGSDGVPVATVRPATNGLPGGWVVTLCAPPEVGQRIAAARGHVLDATQRLLYGTDPAGAVFAAGPPPGAGPPGPGPGRAVWFENMTTDGVGADRFYAEVFGLVARPTATEGYALFVADDNAVAGRLVLPPGLDHMVGVRWMTYFLHPDVDNAATHVVTLGGNVVVSPTDTPTGRVTAVTDPDGTMLTLLGRP